LYIVIGAKMTEETTTEQAQPNLGLNDLILVLQTLQLASSRGAFKPEEFTAIGGCYERIFAFLTASGAINPPEQTPEQPAADSVQQ
jgi:hypothetical protein